MAQSSNLTALSSLQIKKKEEAGDRKMMGTFSDIIIGLLVMTVILYVLVTEEVYAQGSPTAQNIISRVQSECERVTTGIGIELLLSDCVALKHESPNLVVLDAKMFIVDSTETDRFVENDFIWQAVDGFRGQGYTVDSIVLAGGQGNELNPQQEFIVVMSK